MEFLNNLHRLMDPFILPPLVHGPMPPSGPMHLLPALWEAEYVFIRRDGARPSLTPISDKEDWVSVSRLKPLLATGPVVPALPRHRGRPPRLKPPPEPPVVPCRRGHSKKVLLLHLNFGVDALLVSTLLN